MTHVLVLDDDEDLRDAMCELFSVLGLEILAVASLDALIEVRARALSSRLAVLDINLGPGVPSGIDAYRWLREQGYAGRIAMLTGHARSHPLVHSARQLDGVEVLQKPISVDQLQQLTKVAGL